jgi:hypothetical protein
MLIFFMKLFNQFKNHHYQTRGNKDSKNKQLYNRIIKCIYVYIVVLWIRLFFIDVYFPLMVSKLFPRFLVTLDWKIYLTLVEWYLYDFLDLVSALVLLYFSYKFGSIRKQQINKKPIIV